MRVIRYALVLCLAVGGCDCGDDDTGNGDTGVRRDGDPPPGTDTGLPPGVDGGPRMDGTVPGMDSGLPPGVDGGPPGGCSPIMCQTHLYACGNCLDDDGDGLRDDRDPDCLGPCSNNESGFDLMIPGGDSAPCQLDCYYDQDQGPGNDQCEWDHRCDPLEPDHNPLCRYRDPPPPSASCPDPQSEACHDFCGPLTPNGCDCFGCCELPAMSGRYVFIGTVNADGVGTCSLGNEDDPELCHPCTPVGDCLNTCERCELCLGRTELPPECLGPPPADAGPPVDSGPPRDAGPPPPPRCDPGVQPCGLPTDPACPDGFFCLTGCCIFFG